MTTAAYISELYEWYRESARKGHHDAADGEVRAIVRSALRADEERLELYQQVRDLQAELAEHKAEVDSLRRREAAREAVG